ncbi:MAG TPA: c-type cytochrome [Sandaracinaceae bacterium LLY-WYZ-13_1]|nr:c-type cytochrome [Sandaracinaceae bacterium LLY-WYZ-13_1]
MRRGWIALSLGLALLGCDDEEPELTEVQPDPARAEESGERLYRRYCALCHGRDGEGYAADDAPALSNPQWLRTASDDFIEVAIAEGRPGTAMSAWSRRRGGPLTDPQIDALVAYLRSWQRHPRASVDEVPVEGNAQRGRPVYAEECARCHGARGEGVNAIALANPVLLRTASDGFLRYAVAHGRSGTPMPAFAGELAPDQIDDVVAYVRSFERGRPEPPPQRPVEQGDIPALEDMDLVLNPDGPRPDFELREERYVPAADVHEAYANGARMVILDARATSDWLRNRIPGAVPVPFYELDAIVEELPRDGTWMIAYCACPHAASGRVVDALRRHGFTNTAVLNEGIQHWDEAGYPTASGPLAEGEQTD